MQAVKIKEICIVCKAKKIIYCQKRMMCKICYHVWYRTIGKNRDVAQTYYHKNIFYHTEVEFIKNFFKHQNWIYQPANFRINGVIRYAPDFYDGERNIFIEVSGTKQAFENNKEKYIAFKKEYPKINFEIRYSTGELLENMKFHIPEKR